MKTKELIPFIVPDEKEIDDFNLTDYSRRQVNGILTLGLSPTGEQTLVWSVRPGFSEFADLGTDAKIDGMYWWTRQQVLVAVSDGRVFYISQDGTVSEKTGTATQVAGERPSFADVDGTQLFIASSGRIGVYSTGAGDDGYYIADVDAPTNVTHLGTINKILIALKANSEQFYWSGSNNPEVWSSDLASAETDTDLAVGLHVTRSEVMILGQSSIETWRDNGTTFVRELQGFIPVGVIAPHSFTKINDSYFWLSNNREVMKMTGRQFQVISNPYKKFIKGLSIVNDAAGFLVKSEGKRLYVLQFPTEDKTLVYDIDLDRWCEWDSYNGSGYERCIANCYCECPLWGITSAGDSSTGVIYIMDSSYKQDNDQPIRGLIRTDFINRGASNYKKFSSKLIFNFKRTEVYDPLTIDDEVITIGGEPLYIGGSSCSLRYRDNGKKNWSSSIQVYMESGNSTDSRFELRRLGGYYSRQYELVFTAQTNSIFTSAEEEFSYGG